VGGDSESFIDYYGDVPAGGGASFTQIIDGVAVGDIEISNFKC
jgi:hypothetical protein